MSKIMFQFRRGDKEPTVDEVRKTFGIHPDEVDSEFGVVQTDSQEGLYAIMVDDSARDRIQENLKRIGMDSDPATGLFSNPRIEPFGPPKK